MSGVVLIHLRQLTRSTQTELSQGSDGGTGDNFECRSAAYIRPGIVSDIDVQALHVLTSACSGKKTQEEQIELLAMLDRHARTRKLVK